MTKAVYCEKCKRQIESRDDLVTATMLFEVVPYHEECYAKDLKGVKTFILDNQPLNGFSGNVGIVISTIFSIGFLVFGDGSMKWISIFGLIPLIYRLYSYLAYERHLE